MKVLFFISCLSILFLSCEKEIDIKLPSNETQSLVVEGTIETDTPPFVLLTKSFGFFGKVDLGTLQNSFVHGAKISISDDNKTVVLREYTIDTSAQFTFSFYSIDTADPGSFSFVGRENTIYKLRIESEGKIYESTTKIPGAKGPDSIWALPPKETPKTNPDVVQLFVKYADPDTFGNCVRYFTSRNGGVFLPGFNSVFDDEIVNGTTLNANLAAGQEPGGSFNPDSTGYFYKGDTIDVKWAAIEKPVYNFWQSYEFAIRSVGSPFSSPINVKSNISNGALGIWAGYGVRYYRYVVPR